MNISFLTEALPYSQICGSKWVRLKKRRVCNHEQRLGLLEFAVKQTELTQLFQKENSELKAKIVELSNSKDTETCRNEMDLWQRMTEGGLTKGKLAMTLPKTPFLGGSFVPDTLNFQIFFLSFSQFNSLIMRTSKINLFRDFQNIYFV